MFYSQIPLVALYTWHTKEVSCWHVLSTCCCWTFTYFSLFSNLLPKFYLLSYKHGIFSGWVVAFSCIKYMLLLKVNVFLLFSNLLPKFYLSSHEHGIFSKWVVAFPCIKYMLLLKVNVFLIFSNLLPKFHLLSYEHGILRKWVAAFPCIKYMLLLKVNVFLLFSMQSFTQIPLAVLWTWYSQEVSCCLPMY